MVSWEQCAEILYRIYCKQHDLSQDSDLVHASSLPPLLVKSYCVISKEKSGNIYPLFPTQDVVTLSPQEPLSSTLFSWYRLFWIDYSLFYICLCLSTSTWVNIFFSPYILLWCIFLGAENSTSLYYSTYRWTKVYFLVISTRCLTKGL